MSRQVRLKMVLAMAVRFHPTEVDPDVTSDRVQNHPDVMPSTPRPSPLAPAAPRRRIVRRSRLISSSASR